MEGGGATGHLEGGSLGKVEGRERLGKWEVPKKEGRNTNMKKST